jgi:hypothetical protein
LGGRFETESVADLVRNTQPISTASFVTVFFAAPVIRTVDRMLFPSTKQPMICVLFEMSSLFIIALHEKDF